MIFLSTEFTEDDVFEAVSQWLDVLASDASKAWNLLFHPAGEEMTEELFLDLIGTYEDLEILPDKPYAVTRLSKVEKEKSIRISLWSHQAVYGGVAINLPLNGEVSDLVAELGIVRKDDKCAFVLQELHVM